MTFLKLIITYLCFATVMWNSPIIAKKNSDPIKILKLDWTSQTILSEITGRILRQRGYNVEYISMESTGQWYMLYTQKGHVQMEVWQGTMEKKYTELTQAKYLIDAGDHSALTREEWWYPSYVDELCPGLPDWQALRKCKELFAVSETAPEGRYVGGPWEKPDEARIRALDLGFKVIKQSTGDGIWEELKKAVDQKQPVVLFNWSPNWVEAVYDGKFIEFPEHDPACETDAEWGVSKKYTWDCGNPKNGWLKKVVATSVPDTWPCAFKIIQNIDFSNAMIAEIAANVDVYGKSVNQASKQWMSDNKELWQSWLPDNCES